MDVIESKNLITMSNSLARGRFSLNENEILLLLVAMTKTPKYVNSENSNSSNDSRGDLLELASDTPYFITKEDFVKQGISPKNAVTNIRLACENLMNKKVTIKGEVGVYSFNWVQSAFILKDDKFKDLCNKYTTDDEFSSAFDTKADPKLLELVKYAINTDENVVARVVFTQDTLDCIALLMHGNYASFHLSDFKNFQGSYSYRIYLIMMTWKKTGCIFTRLDTFKEMLALVDKYNRITDFKKRVLEPALHEIDAHSPYYITGCHLTDKDGREGKGIKITHIKITFKAKNKTIKSETKKIGITDIVNNTVEPVANSIEEAINKAVDAPKEISKQTTLPLPKKQIDGLEIYERILSSAELAESFAKANQAFIVNMGEKVAFEKGDYKLLLTMLGYRFESDFWKKFNLSMLEDFDKN